MASQIEKIKWIENSKFIVDGFNFQNPNCRHYFLSHYHSDHTTGLNKSFGKRHKNFSNTTIQNDAPLKGQGEGKYKRRKVDIEVGLELEKEGEDLGNGKDYIYTSCITATLLVHQMKISRENIRCVEIGYTYEIEKGKYVSILDANHCPGSIMFLFHDLLHPTQRISPFRSIDECLLVPLPLSVSQQNTVSFTKKQSKKGEDSGSQNSEEPELTERGNKKILYKVDENILPNFDHMKSEITINDISEKQKRSIGSPQIEVDKAITYRSTSEFSSHIDVEEALEELWSYEDEYPVVDHTFNDESETRMLSVKKGNSKSHGPPIHNDTDNDVDNLEVELMQSLFEKRKTEKSKTVYGLEESLVKDTNIRFPNNDKGSSFQYCDSKEAISGILHTGDFRAADPLIAHVQNFISLYNIRIDVIYLDTTYCNKKYIFPDQQLVLDSVGKIARKEMIEDPSTLFFIGTYSIGKERCVKAVARAISSKIYANPDKEKMLRLCGEWDDELFDHDPNNCRVRMAWIGALNVFNDNDKNQKTIKQNGKRKRSRLKSFDKQNSKTRKSNSKSSASNKKNPKNDSNEMGGIEREPNDLDDDNEDVEKERIKNALEKEQPVDEEDEKMFDKEMSKCTNIVGIRPTGWSFRNDRKSRTNQFTSNGSTKEDEDLGVLTKYKPFIRFHDEEEKPPSTSSFKGASLHSIESRTNIENNNQQKPQRKKTKIYSIPYSEHSSYEELRNFIKAFKPKKIIPTVNVYDSTKVEHILGHFLNDMDLSNDKRRLDSFFSTKRVANVRDRNDLNFSGGVESTPNKTEKATVVDLQGECEGEDSEIEIVQLSTPSKIVLEVNNDKRQKENDDGQKNNYLHSDICRNTQGHVMPKGKRCSLVNQTYDKDGVEGDVFLIDYDTESSDDNLKHETVEKYENQQTGSNTTVNKKQGEVVEIMDEEILYIGVGSSPASTKSLPDRNGSLEHRRKECTTRAMNVESSRGAMDQSGTHKESFSDGKNQKLSRGGITSYFTAM